MKRVIIWGTGKTYNKYINLIKYHEKIGNITVVGAASNTTVFNNILGYKYIDKKNIKDMIFDAVIYMGDEKLFKEIKKEAINLGIDEKKIILYKALTIPNLNLNKYMEVVKNVPTIFANDCWGGIVYNRLGLEFSSPLINMFESDEDYIKFLREPRKYMEKPLVLKDEIYSDFVQGYYPVCLCDDILLHFNHYNSFEIANECWERRKKRINWHNLFVMMHTENRDIAIKFSELPYQRKICFVPFPTDIKSLFYVDFRYKNEASKLPFWKIVHSMVNSDYCCYDILELLYSGNVVRNSD